MKFILLFVVTTAKLKLYICKKDGWFQILSTTSAGMLRSKSGPPPQASPLGRLWEEHPLSSELEDPCNSSPVRLPSEGAPIIHTAHLFQMESKASISTLEKNNHMTKSRQSV